MPLQQHSHPHHRQILITVQVGLLLVRPNLEHPLPNSIQKKSSSSSNTNHLSPSRTYNNLTTTNSPLMSRHPLTLGLAYQMKEWTKSHVGRRTCRPTLRPVANVNPQLGFCNTPSQRQWPPHLSVRPLTWAQTICVNNFSSRKNEHVRNVCNALRSNAPKQSASVKNEIEQEPVLAN